MRDPYRDLDHRIDRQSQSLARLYLRRIEQRVWRTFPDARSMHIGWSEFDRSYMPVRFVSTHNRIVWDQDLHDLLDKIMPLDDIKAVVDDCNAYMQFNPSRIFELRASDRVSLPKLSIRFNGRRG